MFVFLICMFLFRVFCVFVLFCVLFCVLCIVLCIVLCNVSPFVYSCLFPIFVHVYRPLPPAGNPIAVNKYHIISYYISNRIISCHVISYHILYHIYHISYHMATNLNCATDFIDLLQHGILKCPSNGVGADTWLRTDGRTDGRTDVTLT
jgi:hypothetical protein